MNQHEGFTPSLLHSALGMIATFGSLAYGTLSKTELEVRIAVSIIGGIVGLITIATLIRKDRRDAERHRIFLEEQARHNETKP